MNTNTHKIIRRVIPLIFLIATSILADQVIVVNNLDSGPGSLRQAIQTANSIGGGTITFSNVTGLITLTSGELVVTQNVSILGPGRDVLAVSGNSASRVFNFGSNVVGLLSGLAIRNGIATRTNLFEAAFGGGVLNKGNLTIIDSYVTNNFAHEFRGDAGGGIASSGSLTLSNVIVSGNSAEDNGGGLSVEGNATIIGSKIYNNSAHQNAGGIWFSSGVMSIAKSSISDNAAQYAGGLAIWWGGVASISDSTINGNEAHTLGGGGGVQNKGDLSLVNCTISGNEAIFGGGGIQNNGILHATNCTVAFNREFTLPTGGGGVHNRSNFYAMNTIIASNSAAAPAVSDFGGVLTSRGHNLIGNLPTIIGDAAGNLYGVDPRLGPLQDNGGPTWTHELLPNSPALDGGRTFGAPVTDQRGTARPQGAAVDIGAFEFVSILPQLIGTTLNNDGFQYVLNGVAGNSFVLQVSSNLVNWSAISTNTIPSNGATNLIDPIALNASRRFYRAVPRWAASEIFIPATSGVIALPFVITNGYIYQPVQTVVSADGGSAVYNFVITNSGNYAIQVLVNAAHEGANSIFFYVDEKPEDTEMISDIPVTAGFQSRTLSWRGNGTFDANEFVPKAFELPSGSHQLFIRGREANVLLQSITILPLP
jgi:hypothetical protein